MSLCNFNHSPTGTLRVGLIQALALLKIISAIRSILKPAQGWWSDFAVVSDEKGFTVTESHRRDDSTSLAAAWSDVSAICFIDGGLGSDCFYIFTHGPSEPVMVPVEAIGGLAFWEALKQRELFPPESSGHAVRSATSGAQIWWPHEASANNSFKPKPLRGSA